MNPRGIPVVMYHSVGPDRPDWVWNHLITPVEVFEGQMLLLRESGWNAISLDLLHSHMAKGTAVPEKPVVLTFDDGYLDSWMYAFPILKKYGHHAAIWMTTDFVDPTEHPRPTLDDVWSKKIAEADLDPRGYLSWAEMREMVRSGLVEVQSHAKTHTWYFSGPEIVDFHRPQGIDGYQFYPWLAWNRFPERKYQSLRVRMEDEIPFGTPVYQHQKSMVVRRFFEDQEVTDRLVRAVGDGGGQAFFRDRKWKARLLDIVKHRKPAGVGFETVEDYRCRVVNELAESRKNIQENLGVAVNFLCWPGGAFSDATLKIAEDVGYLATTAKQEGLHSRNTFGQNPRKIYRIESGSPALWHGRLFRHTDPEFLLAGLERFAGDERALWKLRRLKLKYLIRYELDRGLHLIRGPRT